MRHLSIRRTRTIERIRFTGMCLTLLGFFSLAAALISAVYIDAGMLEHVWYNVAIAFGLMVSIAAAFCFAISSDL